MKTDILTIPTLTLAIKARKLLSKNGINAQVIKIDTSSSTSGCVYAIKFDNSLFFTVINTLKDADIPYGKA